MCAADTRWDEERHLAAAELNVRVVCLYVSRSRCARKQKQRWIISFRLQMCLLRCVKCHRPNSINLPRKHLRTLHHEAPASLWCQSATQTRLSSPTSITGCERVVIDEALEESTLQFGVCVCGRWLVVCVARWPGSWESPPSSRRWSGSVSTAAPVGRLSSRWRRRRRSSWGGTSPPTAGCEVTQAGESVLDLFTTRTSPQNTPKPKSLRIYSLYQSASFTADYCRDLFQNHVSLEVRKLINTNNATVAVPRGDVVIHFISLETFSTDWLMNQSSCPFRSDQTGCWLPISRLTYRKKPTINCQ